MDTKLNIESRQINNFISLAFQMYSFYKSNNFKINFTINHFKKIMCQKHYKHIVLVSAMIENIHVGHKKFKKNLEELKINYKKEKDFQEIINNQDDKIRYMPIIESIEIDFIKYIYLLSNKDKKTISINDIISIITCWVTFSKDQFIVMGFDTPKPLLRKTFNKESFNECSVCLKTISISGKNDEIERIYACEECCNILCPECRTKFKDCPLCHSPFF